MLVPGAYSGGVAAVLLAAGPTLAAFQPYVVDTHTAVLYHFDETAGASDPGTRILNYGSAGTAFDLTNTGGPDGRDNATYNGGGYAAPSYTGFGTAFNVLASGNGSYNATSTANGGGALTESGVQQNAIQAANGAFTYEALIRTNTINVEQEIISHDGSTNRGFLFRVIPNASVGRLAFYNGSADIFATIPTSGDHAFVADQWYHVAVTYTGENTANNLRLYWTRMGVSVTQANYIGGGQLTSDLATNHGNTFGVGTTTRTPFRVQIPYVDEVRLSTVVRAPGDFLVVPEPASMTLAATAAGLLTLRRRRS